MKKKVCFCCFSLLTGKKTKAALLSQSQQNGSTLLIENKTHTHTHTHKGTPIDGCCIRLG
jgi:hypothetical protein